jgi:hypothetical protein
MIVDVMAKSGEAVKSGPMGLAVILILCIVCYFLFKSMSKHLRNVRERYPIDPAETKPEEQAAQRTEPPAE